MKGIIAAGLLALIAAPAFVFAAPPPHPEKARKFDQNHPRRAQVLKRDDRQSHAANAAAKDGKITGRQDARIQRQERSIRAQEQRDAKANGGHITAGEQAHLNREENGVHRELAHDEAKDARTAAGHPEKNAGFDAAHPRRAEVLKRSDNESNRANAAAADGKITAGQDARVQRQERGIRAQEQRDARANGGTITPGEQAKLNREENGVNREIAHDEAKDAQTGH
jgi:hypothetical protein